MKKLKVGDKVVIYEEPWEQTTPEGEAILVKQVSPINPDGISYWLVHFDGDPKEDLHQRFIVQKGMWKKDIPASKECE